jgi:hypothetical protein
VTAQPFDLRSTIERIAAMPAFLDAALERGRDRLRQRPAPGAFSLVEHACHLRDLEREGYLVRVRRMMTEERPALAGFDGGAVASARDYLSQDAAQAAREFAAARRELVGLVASLAAADLDKPATFGGDAVSFARVIGMVAEHDREHRDEIEQLLAKG